MPPDLGWGITNGEPSEEDDGSVDVQFLGLEWGELDAVVRGPSGGTDVKIGRRIFSRIDPEQEGFMGPFWIHSLCEQLVQDAASGDFFHLSWDRPYADPDMAFSGPVGGPWNAPGPVGSFVEQYTDASFPSVTHRLVQKDGSYRCFDGQGRLIVRYGINGIDHVVYSYDGPGDTLDEVIDARGQATLLTFESVLGEYRLTEVTDPLGAVIEYQYDDTTGLLEKVIYPGRTVLENGFDGSGDPVVTPASQAISRSTSRSYEYNGNEQLATIRDDSGDAVLQVAYQDEDPNNINGDPARVWMITNAYGAYWIFVEDNSNPLQPRRQVFEPRGFQKEYFLDADDHVEKVRQHVSSALPGVLSRPGGGFYDWDIVRDSACGCGLITEIHEPNGGKWIMTYDTQSYDLLKVERFGNGGSANAIEWSWTYDSEGRIKTAALPEANERSSPADYTTTFNYTDLPSSDPNNPDGLLVVASNPSGSGTAASWEWEYDSRQRLIRYVGPAHDDSGLGTYREYEYYAETDGVNALLCKRAYSNSSKTIYSEYTWDAKARLTSATTNTGAVFQTTWNEQDLADAWLGPDRGSQQYQHQWYFDGEGRTSKVRWLYYDEGPKASGADTGVWVEQNFWYDSFGNVTYTMADVQPGQVAIREFTYNGAGYPEKETDPDGEQRFYVFDERGKPWILDDGYGSGQSSRHFYEYTLNGGLSSEAAQQDSRYVQMDFEYDDYDRLGAMQIAGTSRVELDTDAGGRIKQIRDYGYPGGAKTLVYQETLSYDEWHDGPTAIVKRVHRDDSGSLERQVGTAIKYGPSGGPTRLTVNGVVYAHVEYEEWGAIKSIYDDEGNREDFFYAAQTGYRVGHFTTQADPVDQSPLVLGRVLDVDGAGRITQITYLRDGYPNAVETLEYDSLDNVVRSTDIDGRVSETDWRYDRLPLTVRRGVDASGQNSLGIEIYEYTPGGKLDTATDARGNDTTYTYDLRGRLDREILPDGSYWKWLYNKGDLVTSIESPTGRTIRFTYDGRGYPLTRSVEDAQQTVLRQDSYAWSMTGHLRSVTKSENGVSSSVSFVHDSTGLVLQEDQDGEVVTYGRDALGRATSLVAPQSTRAYTFDSRNRIKTVSAGGTAIADFDYLGPGNAVRRLRRGAGLGLTLDVFHDGFGRVEGLSTTDSLGGSLFEYEYGWTQGRLIEYEERVHEGLGDVYRYDDLNRLVGLTRDSDDPPQELLSVGSTNHEYVREFVLDGDGHRESVSTMRPGMPTATKLYQTHPDRHHYTSVGLQTRVADADGRITAIGNRTLIYDSVDNLVEVQQGGVTIATYLYDALDRRVEKTVGSTTTRYVYAGLWLVEEYVTSGGGAEYLDAAHYHANGVDDLILSRRVDRADLDQDGNYSEFIDLVPHKNHQGTVMELTLADGTIVESYRYEAFGKPRIFDLSGNLANAPPSGNPFLFTGREYDAETGYYHYRFRAYDPAVGAFLQEDPLGFTDGFNVFAYVMANPVMFVDPLGMSSLGDAVSGLIDFIRNNADIIGDIALDLLGPLGGLLDALSAAIGKDFRGWVLDGFKGAIDDLSWWERAVAGVGALASVGGAIKVIGKLDDILDRLKQAVRKHNAPKRAPSVAGGGNPGSVRCAGVCPGNGQCFAIGTLVLLGWGELRPIEEIALGDVVATKSEYPIQQGKPGEELGLRAPDAWEVVVPERWRRIDLAMADQMGRPVLISLLRPSEWLGRNGIALGADIELQLNHLGFEGTATVLAVGACPPIAGVQARGSRAVTGIMSRWVDGVGVLSQRSAPGEEISVTPSHLVWGGSLGVWLPANDSRLEEGTGWAFSDTAFPSPEGEWVRVYNLEVHHAHAFYVGQGALLVHNESPPGAARGGGVEFSRGGPPRDPGTGNFRPDPDATGAHTTLGTRVGSDGKPYTQGATFDGDGNFQGRTDVTNHGRADHPNPHFHPATGPNSANSPAQPIPNK